MKFSQIKAKGFSAGQEDVFGFYLEQGAGEFVKAASSAYGWDEGAINAGVADIVCGRLSDTQREVFYHEYVKGSKVAEAALLEEIKANEEE